MNDHLLTTTGYDSQYHDRQFDDPYQSTIAFCDWLVELGAMTDAGRICDLGCGKGANVYYMARRFAQHEFLGVDIDEPLVSAGRDFLARKAVSNCDLAVGDLHAAGMQFHCGEFDGIISLQTLSWLPGYEKAFDAMVSLAPDWIGLSSLFFDGPIEARTVITEFDLSASQGTSRRSLFYNTYSLPMVKQYLFENGYGFFRQRRFEIQIDLPRSPEPKMQTYTETTADGRRLQISGPLLMSWYFIYAAKQ